MTSNFENHEPVSLVAEWRSVALILCASIIIVLPAAVFGIPKGNDLPQHYRTALSFHASISTGDLYPGWNPTATDGYGDVSFRFYPPGIYYLLSACKALTGSWHTGTLLALTLMSAAGGIGMLFFARGLVAPRFAAIAGIAFVFSVFHVNEIYQAFMLAQYAGSCLLPFSLAFVKRVIERNRASDVAGLAASYACLVLTHLPLTIIGGIGLVAYALLLLRREDLWRPALRVSAGLVLGLVSGARYWLPAALEVQWLKGYVAIPAPWFDYRNNFLFWKSVEGSTSWWANVLAMATILTLLPSLAVAMRRNDSSNSRSLRAIALLGIISLLMATPLSWPLWSLLPPLRRVEFPWRWLALTSIAASAMLGAVAPYWLAKAATTERPKFLLAAACVLIPLAVTVFQTVRGASYIPRAQFESFLEGFQTSGSVPVWLPAWASDTPRRMSQPVEAGVRAVSIEVWDSEHRSFVVSPGIPTDARVRTFYYPHWKATAEKQALTTRPDKDGSLLISLPASAVRVDLSFREPAAVFRSCVLSVAGWLLIILSFCSTAIRARFRQPS